MTMSRDTAKTADSFRFIRDGYIDAYEAVTQGYPALLADPLIAVAMQQIRLATLAIAARVSELDKEYL